MQTQPTQQPADLSDTSDLEVLNLSPAARRNCERLPPLCYALLTMREPGDRIVGIRRGQPGCYLTTLDYPGLSVAQAQGIVDHYNGKLGVSDVQREALVFGSMFGWHAPGANPDVH